MIEKIKASYQDYRQFKQKREALKAELEAARTLPITLFDATFTFLAVAFGVCLLLTGFYLLLTLF